MTRETTLIGMAAFPGADRSVAHARRFAREVLGPGPVAETVELCVSELVTNAVRHSASGGGGQVTVVLVADGDVIRGEVTDDGAAGSTPHVRTEPHGDGGRGMLIVDALSTRWGVTSLPPGTTVWFECSLMTDPVYRPQAPDPRTGTRASGVE
ncbi:ATP-binding protein [Actinomadura sp. WMMA1423]|uniref:ATP-binding protein n=1 Tax=Actinomadura sp. WMMA1423 TaxID=2591108 RepID=UPI0011461AF6|nr:ATP-binding protein [Actinomadura sp. WMMA1423]